MPSGMIITGLSVVLSLYVMTPVGEAIADATSPILTRISIDDPLAGDSYDALMEANRYGQRTSP